ncbi:ligase-associated DNA damage response DEXH box helicase [Litorimonas sp. RW-G-Af-16]|uniref:ligase-associated DNA damage response DEXH box helicase n=1 Tax=Litorimonas sp. RW-G-Af-16 TaxID=3241168 RepID=UPI003AAE0BAE
MPSKLHTTNSLKEAAVPRKESCAIIPAPFQKWFADQGWAVRDYQREMIDAYARREDTLLIAPTGGGKTLAGFLPSLIDLANKPKDRPAKLHTLYISPLRALTNDIERNLTRPVEEIGLPIRIAARTGDTKQYQRKKQRETPPDILLTTPESLMLLLSYPEAGDYFADLEMVIIDEMHSFATNKRGDFTALALARLKTLAPHHVRFGLSATVAKPQDAATWLGAAGTPARVLEVTSSAKPQLRIIEPETRFPLGGHNPRFAVKDIYAQIKAARSVIVFVNTRAQAEMLFQQLWQVNEDNLPIGVYHGSLARDRRQKTESLIASGHLRAVVSTSALEMGIDWGDVDLILQVGAPKGVSRLLQRIGRSNHRLDEPSKAVLVPTNPLEAVECAVAMRAIEKGERDGEDYRDGAMDVVVQYIVNRACAERVKPRQMLNEIRQATPYAKLSKSDFDDLLQFAVDGEYALKTYERFHRLKPSSRGYQIASVQQARRHRMNIGMIVEFAKLKVRRMASPKSKRGRVVGEIEERFVMNLTPGDTFIFAGENLKYHGIREMAIQASPAPKLRPKVPAFAGGVMPLSSYLAKGVREMLSEPSQWTELPAQIRDWLALQRDFSELPQKQGVMVEAFFDRDDHVLVIHSFEGRKVNQALGFLITQRMEAMGLKPMTFSITDYALTVTSLRPVNAVDDLLATDILDADLEKWIVNSPMVKRSFRKIATIAGLTEQRLPGAQRSMKQVTFSTDLIYDVLMKYEPDHVLLRIAREEAERDLIDIARLRDWLSDVQGRIRFNVLPHASPLAIPSMMQLGKEMIRGEGEQELLRQATERAISRGNDMLEQIRETVKGATGA